MKKIAVCVVLGVLGTILGTTLMIHLTGPKKTTIEYVNLNIPMGMRWCPQGHIQLGDEDEGERL